MMNEKVKNFAVSFLNMEKKVKEKLNKLIESQLEKEKEKYYRKYSKEPDQYNIKLMKKDIVMKNGMFVFLIVFLLLILLV